MRPFKSLRWSLQLWHALILLLVIVVLCILAYRIVRSERMAKLHEDLRNFNRGLETELVFTPQEDGKRGDPVSKEELRAGLQKLALEPDAALKVLGHVDSETEGKPYFAAWDDNAQPLFVSKNTPEEVLSDGTLMENDRRRWLHGNNLLFVYRTPQKFVIVSGMNVSGEMAKLRRFAYLLSASGAGLWLVGLAGGWWLAGRAIKPIGAIASTASRISEGDLSERIETSGANDELASLSNVLNATFDQLEVMIRQQKQFVADASHELRTPVTVIQSEVQRGLKRDRSPEEYREILQTTGRMNNRMKTLIGSLLTLAHQDLAVVDEPCNLGAIVREACEILQPVASGRGTRLSVAADDVTYRGNPQALSEMVSNLVSNAVDHTPAGSEVSVRLVEDDGIRLSVTDNGQGIDPAHLEHLFERFYRVDSSRRSDGHSGLGLAIVKAAAEKHGGRVEVVSTLEKGSTFTVRLPL